MSPCRTRAQKAFTRTDSIAKATIDATPRAVKKNRAKRGWEARYDRSKAFRSAKSGGLGNTPWLNANVRISTPMAMSKPASTMNVAPTAG